ncbi:hypothetical protein [Absidia glauca]|uniref:Uncharacterized protein n=1 Tax=Absidia glauca TaxID=4829 RepID=A0A163IVV7_ABSGL|nr:hypothetical protein [Absidia glauca]
MNIHYLDHIAYIIRQLGPMPSYSCRPLERTIGQFKNMPLSRQSPATSYRKLSNGVQVDGLLLLMSSLVCHTLHDAIELILQTELQINHVLALEALEENAVTDCVILKGQPVKSPEPPHPTTIDVLVFATNWYFRSLNTDSNITISSDDQMIYYKHVEYDGKIYRSIYSQSSARSTSVKFGQATVLFRASNDEYFFGLVHFFFQVTIGDTIHKLVALQVLKGVDQNDNLYPVWNHGSGHYDRLLVMKVESMVDAVGILVDSSNLAIKHLVPSRQLVWDLKVLTNINDIKLKLRHPH